MKKFMEAELEIVNFELVDVITTSNEVEDGIETPKV